MAVRPKDGHGVVAHRMDRNHVQVSWEFLVFAPEHVVNLPELSSKLAGLDSILSRFAGGKESHDQKLFVVRELDRRRVAARA